MFNRETFFAGYRSSFGALDQSQVDGLNFLLDKLESDICTLKQTAYVLATVDHESAHTFQPIKEKRGRPGTNIRRIQDKYWGTGFYGRGYVQITHRANYEKFGIADNPDQALEPETAYTILSRGMQEGLFTGRKLSDYINGQADYRNARKIVNGLDKADEIAARARKYEAILIRSAETVPSAKPVEVDSEGEDHKSSVETVPGRPPVVEVQPPSTSITTKIAAAASAAAPVVAATGMKIGGVEFKTGGIIAFAAVAIVGMVIAAYLWNESQKRRHQELLLGIQNLASPDRANVIAAGSKV